jgi:hypothetical protein
MGIALSTDDDPPVRIMAGYALGACKSLLSLCPGALLHCDPFLESYCSKPRQKVYAVRRLQDTNTLESRWLMDSRPTGSNVSLRPTSKDGGRAWMAMGFSSAKAKPRLAHGCGIIRTHGVTTSNMSTHHNGHTFFRQTLEVRSIHPNTPRTTAACRSAHRLERSSFSQLDRVFVADSPLLLLPHSRGSRVGRLPCADIRQPFVRLSSYVSCGALFISLNPQLIAHPACNTAAYLGQRDERV